LATNGMIALMQAFNKIYRTIEKRGFLKTWTIAVSLTVLLSTSLFLAISLLIVGKFILKFLTENGFLTQDLVIMAIFALRFIVIFITFLLVLSTIYYFAPALHEKWKFISPGSLVATILTMLVSYLFSFYVGNFDSYNKLYGSIGTMIALMVWLYLVSMIILSGFEINASLEQAINRAKRFRNND
jgi:membrane protein